MDPFQNNESQQEYDNGHWWYGNIGILANQLLSPDAESRLQSDKQKVDDEDRYNVEIIKQVRFGSLYCVCGWILVYRNSS